MKKAVVFCAIFIVWSMSVSAQQLFINEFMAENISTIEDPDEPGGAFEDWIEIYNGETNDVSLGGMYLTNDLANLTKWQYNGGYVIPAGGYVLFWADNEVSEGEMHTNFELAASGGEIALVAADGVTIIDSYNYGTQTADVSEGRNPDGAPNWEFFQHPTPSGPNGNEEEQGPYFDQIFAATSTDGINWSVNPNIIFDHASVPGAVYFENKIFLYFVNATNPDNEKLSVGISSDFGNSFDIYDVIISGSHSPHPVDPNPIIENGNIRLTYVGNFGDYQSFDIVTANSADGIHFSEDAVIFSGFVFDPDLFFDDVNNEWILFLNDGDRHLKKATSTSSTSVFSEDPNFVWTLGSISSTHKIGGSFNTYYTNDNGISVTEYANGNLSQSPLAEGIIDFPTPVADPTVAVLGTNNYMMYFKSSSNDNPTPLVLSSFTTSFVGGTTVLLAWTTQTESGNLGWNIYRSESADFQNSLQINSELITGAGTTSEPTNYSFTDENPVLENTTYFYRLESRNLDGTTEIYGPVSLTIPNSENENPENSNVTEFGFHIFPNPFNGNGTIIFKFSQMEESNVQNRKAALDIYNIKGRKIKSFPLSEIDNSSKISFQWNGKNDTNNETGSGIYFFKLKLNNGGIFTKKCLLIR